jgi:sugar/nucleoside kinase (ribokinase family)/fructoselysine-6-P-deglycase FrlB-like protein
VTQQESDVPATATTTPRVVVVGNLTIDDVVLADGTTLMGTLGGNSVHSSAAALVGGVAVTLVARRGDDFPAEAARRLAAAGIDLDHVVDVPGPTVRNWVIYEPDGRRHWVYRTPESRSAEVAPTPVDVTSAVPGAAVVHVAAMPLSHAEAVVAEVRRVAPGAVITLDTHEGWASSLVEEAVAVGFETGASAPSSTSGAPLRPSRNPVTPAPASADERVLTLARSVDLFEPSLEELRDLTATHTAADGLAALDAAGLSRAVVKAGADGAYVLEDGVVTHVPAERVEVVDTTGAGDSFCGGVAAGLARGLPLTDAVTLGVAPAGRAIQRTGSLRLLDEAPAHTTPREPDRTDESAATPDEDYDIDVMAREIAMIPDVVSDTLDDADGHLRRFAQTLVDRDIEHLWLTGCGDSAFAGQAAALAFQRHTAITPHPVHALDLSRYLVRAMPAASAVVCVSFSGKVGRTTEAAIQARRLGHPVFALSNSHDSQLARASDEVVPLDVVTLGFSPGTSTYVAMLGSLLRVAALVSELRGQDDRLGRSLADLPQQAARTLELCADPSVDAARLLLGGSWATYLGAGPNEATARFGAAKLFEGPQLLAVSTNLEEWAHEEYFVTRAGDAVVLVNPSGAGHDRGLEILSELRFLDAATVVVSDVEPAGATDGELWLPLAPHVPEELSPVIAALPLSLVGFHLAALAGKRSYNFPSEEARTEHYDTIHRATIGDPA